MGSRNPWGRKALSPLTKPTSRKNIQKKTFTRKGAAKTLNTNALEKGNSVSRPLYTLS